MNLKVPSLCVVNSTGTLLRMVQQPPLKKYLQEQKPHLNVDGKKEQEH